MAVVPDLGSLAASRLAIRRAAPGTASGSWRNSARLQKMYVPRPYGAISSAPGIGSPPGSFTASTVL